MAQMIFVNLPVADVERSTAFYEALGATKDPRFSTPGTAASMAFSDSIVVMLLSHDHFRGLAPRPIADARMANEVLLSLSRDSRAHVDASVDAAVAAGGRPDLGDLHEMGDYMYGRDVEDLDGHLIGLMWMDVDAAMRAWGAAGAAAAEA